MSKIDTGTVSVIVPVYRSVHSLKELVIEVSQVLEHLDFEIVFVDDCSGDETWQSLTMICDEFDRVRALRLGRNVGQHRALLAGVRSARKAICITMDDDLQHNPAEIPQLLSLIGTGMDVVYGFPKESRQLRWRATGSKLLRKFLRRVIRPQDADRMSSYRAFRTQLRDAFRDRTAPSVSFDVLLSWSTTRFGYVEVKTRPRKHGSSGYSIGGLFRLAFDNATGYSVTPLKISTAIGLMSSFAGFALMGWAVCTRLLSDTEVPGFAYLASVTTLFAGIQLLCIGVIGEYLARMYPQVMNQPAYFVADEIG